MSTIFVNTLTGTSTAGSIAVTGEGNSTTTNLQQGLAKVWIDAAQDLASISDSFNISSLDDDGTGDGGLNYTNNFGSANYCPKISSDDRGATIGSSQGDFTNGTKTASGVDFEVYFITADNNRTNFDMAPFITIHGDLA